MSAYLNGSYAHPANHHTLLITINKLWFYDTTVVNLNKYGEKTSAPYTKGKMSFRAEAYLKTEKLLPLAFLDTLIDRRKPGIFELGGVAVAWLLDVLIYRVNKIDLQVTAQEIVSI